MNAHDQSFQTYLEFLLKRHEWCKSGSAMGAKGDVYQGMKVVKGLETCEYDTTRLDKRNASNGVSALTLSTYIDRLPSLFTSAVRKMENGKGRVLLPTDIVHYYIGCYILDQIEHRLDRRVEVGEPKDAAEKVQMLQDMLFKCQSDVHTWSFDWDNFNGQHSAND